MATEKNEPTVYDLDNLDLSQVSMLRKLAREGMATVMLTVAYKPLEDQINAAAKPK